MVAFSILVQSLTFGRLMRATVRSDAWAPHRSLRPAGSGVDFTDAVGARV